MAPLERDPENLEGLFEYWDNEGEAILKASDKLTHLSLSDEDQQAQAVRVVVKQHEGSLGWWALVMMASASRAKESLAGASPERRYWRPAERRPLMR